MTDYSLRVYDSVLDMLSSPENPTPIVRLNRILPFKHTQVFAKLEWYNPFGAVKDRVAASLLQAAATQGLELENLVEPTSGNTGMALAMLSNAHGYRFTATLSTAIPLEKRIALRAFGASLVELSDDLCPMPGAPEGAMAEAARIGAQPGWHQLNQYKNPANPAAHVQSTGPEIWKQTGGRVTHFVAGLGTCGTITGTGRYLKSQNQAIKVLGVHPADGHDIPGVRSLRALKLTDFFLPAEYDGLTEISNKDAYQMCKRLNQEESIIAGPSSGMALAGALRLVPDAPDTVCVVIFPDNIFKYTASLKKHLPELFSDPGREPEAVATIDGDTATRLIGEGVLLLDVRTPPEFDAAHIAEADNLPLQQIAAEHIGKILPEDKSTPIVTICGVGKRSYAAAQILNQLGYEHVMSVDGGMQLWLGEGRPLKIRR